MKKSEIDEFLDLLDRRGGPASCWEWKGWRHPEGYGYINGQRTHRIAYAMKHGALSPDAVVRHKCDNPSCCNPAHLEVGSHSDNRRDCVAKRRHARGQNHGHAKLTHRQVRFIRTHHKGWTHAAIAQKYGVSRSTITKVLSGETYPGVGSANRGALSSEGGKSLVGNGGR